MELIQSDSFIKKHSKAMPIEVDTLWAQLLLQFHTDSFKLHWCFGHGLKICMWFGYNPQNNFII